MTEKESEITSASHVAGGGIREQRKREPFGTLRGFLDGITMLVVGILFFSVILSPRLEIGWVYLHAGGMAMAAIMLAFILHGGIRGWMVPRLPFLVAFFAMGIYSFFISISYGSNESVYGMANQLVSICVVFVVGACAERLLRDKIPDGISLLSISLVSVSVNSFIIILSFYVPEIKILTESILSQSESSNIDYAEHPFRLRGVAAGGGAALSVVSALASWGAVWLISLGKWRWHAGSVICMVNAFSCVFQGRTGLILSLAACCLLPIAIMISHKREIIKMVFSVPAKIFVVLLIISSTATLVIKSESSPVNVWAWAFEWFHAEDGIRIFETGSAREFTQTAHFPESASEVILGNPGKADLTDSGYLKSLFYLGFPIAVLFYIMTFVLLLRPATYDRGNRWLYLFTLIVAICEVKEPFLSQNYASRLLFFCIGYMEAVELRKRISREKFCDL